MISIESLLLFLFVFTTLVILRTIVRFVISLTKVEIFEQGVWELLLTGLSISYFITYIVS
jgi:hypothetical protein